ncbi:hypothetical protein PVK06_027069 [Gossypium arboreum]|uniref:Mitochondrial protein n=1 Tax=Gossypium arboreum TaxID=29729 RepID=A0ABR0NZC3_GOSAR|nr:hypothetical protein PVK06_027069 [Gossypium arboreum]
MSKVGIFKQKAYVATVNSITPADIHEAMGVPTWQKAIHDELNALICNKTWEVVSVSPDRSLLGCKWLFKIKKNVGSTIGHNKKYVWDLLDQAHMANAKPVLTPMLSSPTLTSLIGPPLSDGTLYRRVIGGLQYVYLTRLDIAFVVNKVIQFMYSPHDVNCTIFK